MSVLPRHVLVVGFRRTGQAVARALAARGVRVRVGDGEPATALGIDPAAWRDVELRLGEMAPALLDGVDAVVPSPGVPRTAPILAAAVARGVPVRSEIELAFGLLDCPVVAITGTNGKSTTTTLVGAALAGDGRRVFTGGNLGTPLIAAVDAQPEIAVAEVSSFQLEWVDLFRPRVAALLNVTPDHLDRHASFEEYRALKARIFARQEPDDVAVLNRDDPEAWRARDGIRARVVPFGTTPLPTGASAAGGDVVFRHPGAPDERYGVGRTRLTGRHNLENIAAAIAVARSAGASADAVQAAIDGTRPLPHRLALVAERGGVRWVDDSKATNVGATVKSLESFDADVLLLAGGVDKGGAYDGLVRAARGRVRLALVFGAAAERMGAALAAGGVHVERVATLDAAVRSAARVARAGDTVLLAPACASFDQFADYAARGRAFCAAVEALP